MSLPKYLFNIYNISYFYYVMKMQINYLNKLDLVYIKNGIRSRHNFSF